MHTPRLPVRSTTLLRHRPTQTSTEAAKARYGARWRIYAHHYLATHPLCRECGDAGQVEPAAQVDHVAPCRSSADPLFWLPANHQALCRRCHGRKTREEASP